MHDYTSKEWYLPRGSDVWYTQQLSSYFRWNKIDPIRGLMQKKFHTAFIILAGLCAAHVIAVLQILQSNARLHRTITAVKDAGYLAVPNDLVAPSLKTIHTALMGGIFFTLSIGAGVTLLALCSTWVWKYACARKPYLAIPFVLPWIAFLVGVNLKGVSILPSLYFTIVPALVVVLAMKFTPDHLSRAGWARSCFHTVVILLLAILWITQINGNMFINIRDRLLLTNSIGVGINDFYYRYTLYPAEAFKSLHQKMIKTCRADISSDRSLQKQLLVILADRNYLAVKKTESVDLAMVANNGKLLLLNRGHTMIETSLAKFMATPGPLLKSFSRQCDRHVFFRQFTFLSLLVAFPVVLYIFVHAFLCRLATFFIKPGAAVVLAGLLCLVIGALLILPVKAGMQKEITPDQISDLLQSVKWQDNVDALKTIAEQKRTWKVDIGAPKLVSNPHIPVRYWLARGLARSTDPKAHADLLKLMDDPQPIVACQALYSLGQRGGKQTIKIILDKIRHSDHWYVQWYAYNALRVLGWRQKISI